MLVGGHALRPGPVQAHEAGRVLQVVGPWEIGGLHPAVTGHLFQRFEVLETLLEADDAGRPLPGLAATWRVGGDGLRWQFNLRPRARFHDGTDVDAEAVVASLRRAQTPPGVLAQAPIVRMHADGARTVHITLSAPCATLPALLAHSSTVVLAPSAVDAQGQVRRIVGSGPYRITRLVPPQTLAVGAAPTYDGPAPAVQQARYLSVSRAETRALMAEGGQADLAMQLDPASWQRLRLRRHLRIEAVTLPRTITLKLNAGLGPLRDVRVRRALSLCIDRHGIAKALLRAPHLAATQLLSPAAAAWHDPALAPLGRDPVEAARLLREAGWTRHTDGLRDAQGQPLTLTLRTFPDRPELPIVATALQEQWRQAGLAVQVRIGNSGDIPLGHRDGTLQLALMARNYGSIPDVAATLLQDFGPNGGDWGAMGWQHPEVTDALTRLDRLPGATAEAQALRRRVVRILHAELPVIPVAWYRQQVAVSQRVRDVSLDPLERSHRISRMRWNP